MQVMKIIFITCIILSTLASSYSQDKVEKFDEFGSVNCEGLAQRLDHFSVPLRKHPELRGYIIFYGGRLHNGRLMKRREAEARAEALRRYLIYEQRLDAGRVILINGGYRKEWMVELWHVPGNEKPPAATPTVEAKDVRFRRGKTNWKDYVCIFG